MSQYSRAPKCSVPTSSRVAFEFSRVCPSLEYRVSGSCASRELSGVKVLSSETGRVGAGASVSALDEASISIVSSASELTILSARAVQSVGCVGSIPVKRCVASRLCSVASVSGSDPQGPKSAVLPALERSRRAAATGRVQRLVQRQWQRLAPQIPVGSSQLRSSWSSAAMPGECSGLRRSESKVAIMRRVQSSSLQTMTEASLHPVTVVPVASVQSVAPVGEWRLVSEALHGVLSSLASKVEASTTVSSTEPGRVH